MKFGRVVERKMEGYLHKNSGGKLGAGRSAGNVLGKCGKWDKRWFSLLEGSTILCYFKDASAANCNELDATPLGELDLLGCSIDRATQPGDLRFAIHTPTRVLRLRASDFDEVDQWCAAISTAAGGFTADRHVEGDNPAMAENFGLTMTIAAACVFNTTARTLYLSVDSSIPTRHLHGLRIDMHSAL